jgi:anti-sigma factor RsiW
MELAEFAENRLSGPASAAVEAYLASHPAVAEDVASAARAAEIPFRPGDVALAVTIARAATLVPAAGAAGHDRVGDNIVPFRAVRPATAPWPIAARWGALAASLALVSWLGFALGSDAYGDLAALDGQSGTRLADELLDPPGGFFSLADQSGT